MCWTNCIWNYGLVVIIIHMPLLLLAWNDSDWTWSKLAFIMCNIFCEWDVYLSYVNLQSSLTRVWLDVAELRERLEKEINILTFIV
jgi:hypothetical protein